MMIRSHYSARQLTYEFSNLIGRKLLIIFLSPTTHRDTVTSRDDVEQYKHSLLTQRRHFDVRHLKKKMYIYRLYILNNFIFKLSVSF